MKKILIYFFLLLLGTLTIFITILSTKGIETKRFNKIISEKIIKTNKNIDVEIKKILIKFDIKTFEIFLSTSKPKLSFNQSNLPINEIRTYVEFNSIFKNRIEIKNIYIDMNYLSYKELRKILVSTKPSNLKSIILNNIIEGDVKAKFEINFDKDLTVNNYQVDGHVKNLNANIKNNINIKNTDFIFSLGKNRGFLQSVNGKLNDLKFSQGKIDFNVKNDIRIDAKINNSIDLTKVNLSKYFSEIPSTISLNNFNIKGEMKNKVVLTLDKTLKILNYDLKIEGKLKESFISFKSPIKNSILYKEIETIFFNKTDLIFSKTNEKNHSLILNGKYKINNSDYLNFKINNKIDKFKTKFLIEADIAEGIKVPIINYQKEYGKVGNFKTRFEILKKSIIFKEFKFNDKKNLIKFQNLRLNEKRKFNSIEKIEVFTTNNGKVNNDFTILFKDKIVIKGKKYDSKNLNKIISQANGNDNFRNINSDIQISLNEIFTKLPNELKNFNLLGTIKKGNFIKINAKGDFTPNEHIDISLKKDKDSDKKYLEIFSDIPEVLLADYDFFKGLVGGKLLYSSVLDNNLSYSKLSIENFKVINAPGLVKLLSIADFRGMADVLSGEGLSFEKLELKFSRDNQGLKLEELFAVGPSVSILMDGYVENKSGLISLRGTMVPAKNINKFLSKIPVVGKIIIPKEVGEGLFGVSFKIKGYPKNTKTTVNPLKTLTPRFITKALEKRKSK